MADTPPTTTASTGTRPRARELGVRIGVMSPGVNNAITDVAGVRVGHVTLIRGADVRTGVTAILPHAGDSFREKVPAGLFVGNGFGKLAGATQVEELGTIETPIVLTNTLAVPQAIDALIDYTLSRAGNENVRSVNAVVGETNDSQLSDIRGRHVTREDVRGAIEAAAASPDRKPVEEGCVGAGTGTVCFGFKGGIGTASRVLPRQLGGYTVGAIVQTNFGGVLQIGGVPVGQMLGKHAFHDELQSREGAGGDASGDGSCMIVVATDAPLGARNLRRLATRAFMGLARTGGIASHGSGDYAIAFSTESSLRVPHATKQPVRQVNVLHDDFVSPLFLAAIEATEEAIINSLFAATTTTGVGGRTVDALPVDTVVEFLRRRDGEAK